MSSMFRSKQVTPQYDVVADPYKAVREPTVDWLKGQIGKPAEQYGGEFVAPATEQERSSIDWLKKYTEQGPSEGFGLAKDEVRRTMTEQYDPTSSPYYQAVKAEAAKNLVDAQSEIGSQAAGGGRYWTGARLGEQGRAATETGLSMNKLLYGMQEKERERRLSTAPFAAQLGQYEEMQPLARTEALQQYGSLERQLQQARNDAIYNEWLRATQEYPLQIGSLASGLAREPYYAESVKNKRIIPKWMTWPFFQK